MTLPVYVYTARVDWDSHTTHHYLQTLTTTDQQQAKRYTHALRLRSFVGSRLLLKRALNDIEQKNQDWHFGRQGHRLILDAAQTKLHASLSHSQDWVACVVSHSAHCGIDIEQRQPNPSYLAIAQRFFHPQEYLWLLNEPESSRFEVFVDVWTRKEASVKAWHVGLAHHLASIRFDAAQLSPVACPTAFAAIPLTLHTWSCADWQLCAAVHVHPQEPDWHYQEVCL